MNCSGEARGLSSNITQNKKLRMIKSVCSEAKRTSGNVAQSISCSLQAKIHLNHVWAC